MTRRIGRAARRAGGAMFSVFLATSALTLVPARPAVAAAAKSGKLSPRLAQLASGGGFASSRAEARALSLPSSGFGSLETRPGGRVVVDIRTADTSAGGVAELRDLGAQILDVSAEYSTVTASVAPGALSVIASDPAVQYVMEGLAPNVGRITPPATHTAAAADPHATCAPIVSEGDSLMHVATARSANNVTGAGETVGVLSDSFDADPSAATHAAQDVVRGDLPGAGNPCGHPTPVDVVADGSGSGQTDEGRAMTQLAHDLAPGAGLAFATIGASETQFASNIDALRTQAHASVMVDDAFYPNEPFFQDGPVANAANRAITAGIPYFSAAGNENLVVGGNDVASYEAPAYRPTACPTLTNIGEPLEDCHDFDPTGGVSSGDSITVAPGGGFDLDLQWAEPIGAVATDFDVLAVNGAGTILAGSAIDNISSEQPFEFFGWGNTGSTTQTVRIVIARFSGSATPRLKFVLIDSGGIDAVQFNTSSGGDIVGPGIIGHAGTSGVGATAAIPYNDSTTPESYSARGPVTHYFQPVPSTTALGSPDVIDKPDFAATDGVRTSFFAQQIGGVWRFFGTSAAAPQAAAIGALLRSKDPLLRPAQVITAMHDTARAVTNDGTPDVVGGGYLDANAALASVLAFPGAPRSVHGSPGDGQVTVSWTAPASNGGIPITGYTVTPSINGVAQTPVVFNSAATTQTITGLTDGTPYTFVVTASDTDGSGPDSDPSDVVNVGTPAKPTGVTVTATANTSVTLRWVTPASTNGATLTGYVITPFFAGAAGTQTTVGITNTATVTGLANGFPYTFEVAATSDRGDGEPSDPTAPFAVDLARAPTNVVATPGNASATVSFTAPASNGTHITGYHIVVYEGSQVFANQNASSATKQHVPNLVNGHPFRFRVAAMTNGGNGPASALSAPITAGVPTAPGGPTVGSGSGRVSTHWSPSVSNGSAVTKYVVTAVVGGVTQAVRTYSGKTTGATIANLENGRTFLYKVKAVNARGSSATSSSPSVVVGAPSAPRNVRAQPGHNEATVSWSAPSTNNGAAIRGYTVIPILQGVAQKPIAFHSAATTHVVTALKAGDTYTFVVTATNARGVSPRSAPSKTVHVT